MKNADILEKKQKWYNIFEEYKNIKLNYVNLQ